MEFKSLLFGAIVGAIMGVCFNYGIENYEWFEAFMSILICVVPFICIGLFFYKIHITLNK